MTYPHTPIGCVGASLAAFNRLPSSAASSNWVSNPSTPVSGDDSTVDSEDRMAWSAALDPEPMWTDQQLTPALPVDDVLHHEVIGNSRNGDTSAISHPSASERSHTGSTGDNDESRRSPSTRFELLLTDATFLQVDWSRQSTHWSLCLRTESAQTFGVLSNAKNALCTALEAGFGQDVAIEVVQR